MANVLIRCDASKKIGLGHVTRCLVLAKQLKKEGYNVIFAMKKKLGVEIVLQESFVVEIAPEHNFNYEKWIKELILKNNSNIFIGDIRDNFPARAIKHMNNKNILTIAIDEPGKYAKECQLCFYPPHAKINKTLYKGQVYQGLEYVILREEFYKPFKKTANKIPNILVMMGGTDAKNLTYKVVNKLYSLNKKIKIQVVLDKNNKQINKINKINKKIKINSNIKNMANFLKKIDLSIISFGVSAYEMALMKIPSTHICLTKDHWEASEYFLKKELSCRLMYTDIKKIDIFNIKNIDIKVEKNAILDVIKKSRDKYNEVEKN